MAELLRHRRLVRSPGHPTAPNTRAKTAVDPTADDTDGAWLFIRVIRAIRGSFSRLTSLPPNPGPSPVSAGLAPTLAGRVRVSVHFYNREEEIDRVGS